MQHIPMKSIDLVVTGIGALEPRENLEDPGSVNKSTLILSAVNPSLLRFLFYVVF